MRLSLSCLTLPYVNIASLTVSVDVSDSAKSGGYNTGQQNITEVRIFIDKHPYDESQGAFPDGYLMDGIFDSEMESFSITSIPVAKGSHKLELKAINGAGNSASQLLQFTVK